MIQFSSFEWSWGIMSIVCQVESLIMGLRNSVGREVWLKSMEGRIVFYWPCSSLPEPGYQFYKRGLEMVSSHDHGIIIMGKGGISVCVSKVIKKKIHYFHLIICVNLLNFTLFSANIILLKSLYLNGKWASSSN